jgi:large subunit ribosomal protein L35
MPKIKTHRGTAKRVKKSATGKLIRERAYTGHFLAKKSAGRKRNNARSHSVSRSNVSNVKRALGA